MDTRKLLLYFSILVFISLFNPGCLVVENPHSGLPPGPWRAILKLELNPVIPNPKGKPLPEKMNQKIEEVAAGELPFNFEVIYPNPDSFYIKIKNGVEEIIVDDIHFGRDLQTAKDTVVINFPVFDSYIRGIFVQNILEGEWVVNNRENYRIPFVAYHGKDHRFTQLKKEPIMDISGRWEVTMELDSDTPFKAIGDFKQEGNYLTGTFETETGDYRFLEGTVQENRMFLSVFDGSHAFLFGARINPDTSMSGFFLSGKHYKTVWEAKRNPNFKLGDPNELTFLKEGYDQFDFAFENLDGDTISLKDDRYKDKIKIVQIFGTWCPNCRDATNFLLEYLNQNPDAPVEVIALAFEKHKDREKAFAALRRYKEKIGMDYELLLAGATHVKSEAAEILPMLNTVLSFPTLIFIDKNNKVRRIHTGFNGPATKKYKTFKTDFENFVVTLQEEEAL